jgi:hypothetical protein
MPCYGAVVGAARRPGMHATRMAPGPDRQEHTGHPDAGSPLVWRVQHAVFLPPVCQRQLQRAQEGRARLDGADPLARQVVE